MVGIRKNIWKEPVKARTVWSDGALYFVTATGTAFLTYIGTEEAYKYCDPTVLFWLKVIIGSSISGANAIKAFRSMTFARHAGQGIEPTKNP